MCEHEEQVIKQLDSSEDKEKYKPAFPWIAYGECLFLLKKVEEAIEQTKEGIKWMETFLGESHD